MRALVFDFPNDRTARTLTDEYLFGPSFLVCPVTKPEASTRSVYLPSGTAWTDFWTGNAINGGKTVAATAYIETMPLYIRAGSIVPMGPDLQYAAEKPADPIELRVYPGANGTFTLYEDENDTYHYEKGVYATIPITWDQAKQTLTIGARQGAFPGMLKTRTFRVVWVKPGHGTGIAPTEAADMTVHYAGQRLVLKR
jgi:alpha-D-xyloside xylohydrolase